MTGNTLNIFDLNPSKTTAEQFGLLESIDKTDTHNVEQQEPSFDMIFGNMLASISPELSGKNEALLQNPLANENQELTQITLSGQNNDSEEKLVDENILAFNKELDGLNLQKMSLQNINIKEILASQGKDLENGQYKVLSKEIVDSQVALTVESSSGKQLTITLPIESIQNLNSNPAQQRVSIENSYYQKELESLVEKVNISQIEIKSSETKSSQSALKPVEISLVGEHNAATVTLKASLKNNQIKITKSQTTTSHQKAAVLDESGLFDEKVGLNQNQSNKLIENASLDSKQQFTNLSTNDKQQMMLKKAASGQSVERTDSILYSYNTETVDATEQKESIQNVRMQLPENIKSVLRPNGQAVLIKMNPENLGPAKLSLTFSGGKLRAKLIVSSVNAKHMLDNSMSRLVDQLQKIDIIVDKLNVTLDENNSQNEQFNQNQQWQRKMSYKNVDVEQFEQNELEQVVRKPILSVQQQISSGSVNFLA